MTSPLHKIRQIREARGMSQQALGELIGRTKGVVSRLESGETSLDLEMAAKMADALKCTLPELLGFASLDDRRRHTEFRSDGFYEDELQAYTPTAGDPLAAMVLPSRYLMIVQSDAIEKMGIRKGDKVLIDESPSICMAPPPLAAVFVTLRPDPAADRSVALLRQFVPPSLLITNRGSRNDPSLDMASEAARIAGVVVWSGRSHI